MTVDDRHLIRVTVDIVVKGVDIIPIDRDEVDVVDANRKCIKGIWNSCGMVNHHTDLCHFLMKLHHTLVYLGVDHEVGFKKKE